MTILLYPFVALSALGLALSIFAHVSALLGFDVPSAAFVLHIGIFVVWIPTVFVSNTLAKNHDRKDFWKVVLRGAPKWAQYIMYGFFYYAIFNFAIFFLPIFGIRIIPNLGLPMSDIRLFSGHWMVFYSAALITLYSAIQIQRKGSVRKCVNGHQVSNEAVFCDQCGQMILDEVK